MIVTPDSVAGNCHVIKSALQQLLQYNLKQLNFQRSKPLSEVGLNSVVVHLMCNLSGEGRGNVANCFSW